MEDFEAMDELNIPVQMISVCNVDGTIRPIRFRFEDREHLIQTVGITKILSSQEIKYVGIEAFVFVCCSVIDGQEKQFELKYTVRTHQWALFRILY